MWKAHLSRTVVRMFIANRVRSPHLSASTTRFTSTKRKTVAIGDIETAVRVPHDVQKVPLGSLPTEDGLSQNMLRHLRWMMQKDNLGQDIFLLGMPGRARRQLALAYCEMTQREVEYIALTRDTTEADLKQRREIRNGSAVYLDQCAVRAALNGSTLVIEGIEKAERNLLPILNNLMENREMHLEDGRFLVAPQRYDALRKEFSEEHLQQQKLLRVHDDFRIIALGLPVPPLPGNPLDPPLRSRFQVRHIEPTLNRTIAGNESIQSFAETIQAINVDAMLGDKLKNVTRLPMFPDTALDAAQTITRDHPTLPPHWLVSASIPKFLLSSEEAASMFKDVRSRYGLDDFTRFSPISNIESKDDLTAAVTMEPHTFYVPKGILDVGHAAPQYVSTKYTEERMSQLVALHGYRDVCIIGDRGVGKSVLVDEFAARLGYRTTHVMMHKDMTVRDLLQQRSTKENGDTAWSLSPLVQGALQGDLVVLDGIHRVDPSTISALQRLTQDRELTLFDGTTLLPRSKVEQLMKSTGLNEAELAEKGVLAVHPSFRIIALAEPPSKTSTKRWLNEELQTMFSFLQVHPLNHQQQQTILEATVPSLQPVLRDALINLSEVFQNAGKSPQTAMLTDSFKFSTRHVARVAKRLAAFPDSETLPSLVERTMLAEFLPTIAKDALRDLVQRASPSSTSSSSQSGQGFDTTNPSITVTETDVIVGDVSFPIRKDGDKARVPDITFYDNPTHAQAMREILKDMKLGDHTLLVGNQGVGKNKVADRILQLLQYPREYLQLHRDTTVQSLSQQPSVVSGQLIYEDSPLVRAVREGSCLVVDEADKAPIHVTCVLKTLVESGEMQLADGRRIVPSTFPKLSEQEEARLLRAHPDFRMIFLANRPGFPFLGNDFYASMGDLFSCHAISNPGRDYELEMLRAYGPSVDSATLEKVAAAFDELRALSMQGKLTYPYSMREVVSVVRHLEKFPQDGVAAALLNVFDFDAFEADKQTMIMDALKKHGIPLRASTLSIQLAESHPLDAPKQIATWKAGSTKSLKKRGAKSLSYTRQHVEVEAEKILSESTRWHSFSEQEHVLQLRLHTHERASDVATNSKNEIFVLSANPEIIYKVSSDRYSATSFELPSSNRSSFYRGYVTKPSLSSIFALENTQDGWDAVVLDQEKGSLTLLNSKENTLYNVAEGALGRIASSLGIGGDSKRENVSLSFGCQLQPHVLLVYSDSSRTMTLFDFKENSSTKVDMNDVGTFSGIQSVSMLSKTSALVQAIHPDGSIGTFVLKLLQNGQLEATQIQSNHNVSSYRTTTSSSLAPELVERLDTADYINYVSLHQDLSSVAKDVESTAMIPQDTSSRDPRVHVAMNFPSPHNGQTMNASVFEYTQPKLSALNTTQARSESSHELCQTPYVGSVQAGFGSAVVHGFGAATSHSATAKGKDTSTDVGQLAVFDFKSHTFSSLSVPQLHVADSSSSFSTPTLVKLTSMQDGTVLSLDTNGVLRWWTLDADLRGEQLAQWTKMVGSRALKGDDALRMEYNRHSGLDAQSPKHGKVDPKNEPHVGGNTWAGGTGGRDTAGLGGKGGPYRLDAGHDVHQLSDAEKEALPDHIKQAARELGQKAFQDKLREINMTEHEAEIYNNYVEAVKPEIVALKSLVATLQSKGDERTWLTNQTMGDFDDAKIVDGITGDQAIYKRRGEAESNPFAQQEKPKILRVVVDVSGSMYRFNGLDQRLQRELETVCLLMEGLQDTQGKLEWEVVGHSGDSEYIPFVKRGQPPKNDAERLKVLKLMVAHSQYCMSGDHTLEATRAAVRQLAQEDADERLVVVLTDANLDRYGIPAWMFGDSLVAESSVNAYAIMIGALGDQAEKLRADLPPTRGFICMDTKELPTILTQIFQASVNSANTSSS
eukprot:m.84891 g.84891  ORF g.84891 m.84891 type:complete len:1894 (-) comp12765_c0_seq4:107-5788(-)